MALFTALLGSIQISATKQYKDPSLYVINSELSVSKIFYKLSSFNLTVKNDSLITMSIDIDE